MRILAPLLIGTFILSNLYAETIYTLRGVDKVYPVVEIGGSKIPKEKKADLRASLDETTKELGLDTSGYAKRSLALLVREIYVGKDVLINVRLLIGEPVRRMDSGEEVFAHTYDNSKMFLYRAESAEENLDDAADELLEKFADQYREEHGAIKRVADDGDIAQALHYETNFDAAVARAEKEHKNVMLVLVSNFCPWCRKFEQQVLRKTDVNALVHGKYVPVILNKEKDAFPPELNLSFTPIVHFIDPATLKSYHKIVGYNEREEFLHWLQSDVRK